MRSPSSAIGDLLPDFRFFFSLELLSNLSSFFLLMEGLREQGNLATCNYGDCSLLRFSFDE